MGGAVAAAAAASVQAQKRVISHFMSQNAVSAAQAVPFTAGKQLEQKFFDRMRDEGVIVGGGNGGYWLDIPKWDAWTNRPNVAARWIVLAVAVLVGIALVLVIVLGGR